MTRILALLLSLFVSLPVLAETPYFCNRQGAVLNYERSTVQSGKLKWTQELKVSSVSGGHIDYSTEFRKPQGGMMYGGPVKLDAYVDAAGNVQVDLASSMVSVLRSYLPDSVVKTTECISVLPSDMKPGDTLPDASFSISAAGVTYKVAVTDRKVLREERIVTEAGEFDCLVVSEHKVEKGLRNRTTTALTWYSRGIGMVRHDTYDKNMKLDTSEILVKIR